MHPLRLLADIGGTNIRLAWQASPDGPLNDTRVLPCAQFPTVDAALSAYLREVGVPTPREAAFGIANPVTGDAIRMTNHSWSFSQRAVREAFGFERLVVINDFTALALALPLLTPDLLRPVGGGEAVPGAAIALLGPGTGLGVSGLVFPPGSSSGVPLSGEGGHVSLAAQTQREFDVLAILQERYGHVSAERAVSGAGLVDLYHALRRLAQRGGKEVRAGRTTEFHVCAAPIGGGERLRTLLWDRAGAAVLTSATPLPSPALADGATTTVTLTPTSGKIINRDARWTFSYLNQTLAAPGTYGGINTNNSRVTYTASMP